MTKSLGIFMGNGAFGDQAFSLCAAYGLSMRYGYKSYDIHTARDFFYIHGQEDQNRIQPNPSVFYLWSQCSMVDAIYFDVIMEISAYERDLPKIREKHTHYFDSIPIELAVPDINMKSWLNLEKDRAITLTGKKRAIFHPISLGFKPKAFVKDYIMHWDKSLEALFEKGYEVYMIGGPKDEELIHNYDVVNKKWLPRIHNLINKISMIQALELIMYQADIVVSCDSWSAPFAVANQVKTCITLGPKMASGEDKLYNFCGNKGCYVKGLSALKSQTDLYFANYIAN